MAVRPPFSALPGMVGRVISIQRFEVFTFSFLSLYACGCVLFTVSMNSMYGSPVMTRVMTMRFHRP